MVKGFGLVECLIALSLSLIVICIVLTQINQSSRCSQKMISNQQRMESIFHTINIIRADLMKCGQRLQEPAKLFGFPLFVNDPQGFKVTYGLDMELLVEDSPCGQPALLINQNDYFKKGKAVMLYNPEQGIFEYNEISAAKKDQLFMENPLQHHYPKNSILVLIKEVEYKLYAGQSALKRKVNKGYFQPLIEEVTDFFIQYYPESLSVYYRIEINHKEQVRGYIYLTNLSAY